MSIKNAIQFKNEPKAKIGKPPEGVDQLLGVDYWKLKQGFSNTYLIWSDFTWKYWKEQNRTQTTKKRFWPTLNAQALKCTNNEKDMYLKHHYGTYKQLYTNYNSPKVHNFGAILVFVSFLWPSYPWPVIKLHCPTTLEAKTTTELD